MSMSSAVSSRGKREVYPELKAYLPWVSRRRAIYTRYPQTNWMDFLISFFLHKAKYLLPIQKAGYLQVYLVGNNIKQRSILLNYHEVKAFV